MLPSWGDWDADVRDDPYAHFAAAPERCPVQHVRLGDGPDAWLVVGHAAARQALKDPRFSKDMLAAMDADPDVVDEGLPGPAFARHMLAVDPPDHTRLRGLVAKPFAPSRIAALEPRLEKIAQELLDGLERSGPVVDLVAGFALAVPLPRRSGSSSVCRRPTSRRSTRRSARCSSPGAARPRRRPWPRQRRSWRTSSTWSTRAPSPTDDLVGVLVTAEETRRAA